MTDSDNKLSIVKWGEGQGCSKVVKVGERASPDHDALLIDYTLNFAKT